MILIYENGMIDLNKVLNDIGNVEFCIEYDEDCYKLKVWISKSTFLMGASSVTVYEAPSRESVEELKKMILVAYKVGRKMFVVKDMVERM